MHALPVQQQQRQRLVQQRTAFVVRGVEADDLVRAHEPRVHSRPPLFADVDEERRGGRRSVGPALRVGLDEQLDHRLLFGRRQHLGVEFEPEQRGEQPALAGDLHLPGCARQFVGLGADEVADAQPAGVGGEFGEPTGVLGRGLSGQQHQVRGPTGVLRGPGAAGEHGVVPGGAQRAAPLPRLGLHGLEERLDAVEVAQAAGSERGQVLTEADEGDGHAVRPAVGGEFGGDRGENGGPVGGAAAQRDDAGHGLQVEQQAGVVHGAETDEPGVRGGGFGLLVLLGVGARQHPERLVLPGPPGRGRLAGRLCELEVQVASGEPGGVDDGQRPGLGGEGGGEGAQGPVEPPYALGVGAHQQRVLHVQRVPGRRRRLHAAPPADGTERRLPQCLPAPVAECAEETGGEERGAEEGFGQSEGTPGGGGGGGGGAVTGMPLPVLSGVGGGPLGGYGGVGAALLMAAALRVVAPALRVVAGLGVVVDLLPHLLGDVRRSVGHLDELAAVRVRGHLHDPAGPDEAGLGQPGAVGLDPVLVELVDLLVPAPVAEVPLGDLPERVVVASLGRLDPVVLRVALLGLRLRGGARGLLGDGRRGVRGLLPLLPEQPARRLLRGGDGALLVPLQAVPELRQPRGEAGGRGPDEQQRGDELPREQLAGAGAGHPPRHPDAGERGLHLHEHTGGELRPGEPDDDRQDAQEGLDGDLLLEPVQARHAVRQRPSDLGGQRQRYADEQDEQGQEGEERLHEVPDRAPPHPHRLRRPVPRGRRASRRVSRRASRRA